MRRDSFCGRLVTLRNRNRCSFYTLFLLGGICTLIYYFGEIVDFAGWEALRWELLYGVHDIQRLFFLALIIYTGYVFGVRAVIFITVFAVSTMLFRALYVSPFPDPMLRTILFGIVAGTIGYVIARVCGQFEESCRLEALARSEKGQLLGIFEGMRDGVLLTGPDYRIRFANPGLIREFKEKLSSHCYEYLHGLDEPCPQNCKLSSVINGKIERWEHKLPDGRTYDVVASPCVDSDGIVCQLTVFRKTARNEGVTRGC
ncbi:hypothetical protein ACFLU1_04930 [Chloroflexota bacterium]